MCDEGEGKPNPAFYSCQLGLAAMIQRALAWRPTGPSHQHVGGPDDLGIAIRSTTERSWPVHKFQNFLGERSLLHNFPSRKMTTFHVFLDGKLSTTRWPQKAPIYFCPVGTIFAFSLKMVSTVNCCVRL